MKANYLSVQILFVLLAITPARGQNKTVLVLTPPEINLVPPPSRIVVFQDLESDASAVVRQKKEDLINECADSLLSVFGRTIMSLLPSMECIVLPVEKTNDSFEKPLDVQRRYKADLAFTIADFRPQVVQGEVTKVENEDHSKTKTAEYYMSAGGSLRIYSGDSLLGTFTFSERKFLQKREVLSGLFAAGPPLVKNREAALGVTNYAAQGLAGKLVPQNTSYTVTLFKKKELKTVTDLIVHNNYAEALPKALQLTTHENEAIASRACYLCALLYHVQMDFARAFEYAEKARKLKIIVTKQQWNSYYYFLKKYAVDNKIAWKE